ncbi:MAG: hypothetical protein ABJD11_10860 [Gemmatimonadota bacterium]
MRSATFLLIALALGCADGTGPALGPCANAGSAADLCGTWAADSLVTGSTLIVEMRLHGSSVVGAGKYTLEAGRSGTLQMFGTYQPPVIELNLVYDSGLSLTYAGTVSPTLQITGTSSDGAGHNFPLSFSPR